MQRVRLTAAPTRRRGSPCTCISGHRAWRRQPGISAFGQAPQGAREWAGNPGFSRIRFRLQTPSSPILRLKSPKVSGHVRGYSRFAETIGGDWFDHDCRPRAALSFRALIRFLTNAYQLRLDSFVSKAYQCERAIHSLAAQLRQAEFELGTIDCNRRQYDIIH